MRLVAAVLFGALTTGSALADEPKPLEPKPEIGRRKVPLRVVTVLPESHQALLYDRSRSTHILVDVGEAVAGYVVDEIDEDGVTLIADGREIVLAAPEPPVPPPNRTQAPLDPYAANDTAPVDPYGDPAIRVAVAPPSIVVGDGSVRVAGPVIHPAAADPGPAWADLLAPPESPAVTPPDSPAVMIARAELNRALGDFPTLAATLRASFTPAGARLDAVADGSLFARAGLRTGDVVTAIDGRPLRSLDDAAELYARTATVKAVSLQVVRGGKAVTLRVSIR